MTCPNCKAELSKVWQPQRATSGGTIAHVVWSCSTCGGSFTRDQLRPRAKRQASTEQVESGVL